MHRPQLVILLVASITLLLTSCGGSNVREKHFEPPVYPPPPNKVRFIFDRMLQSSADVKEFTTMEKFKLFATGSVGRVTGMTKPYGVAVYQGRVYVSDTVQRVVLMFDYPGHDFKVIGTEGPGRLLKPIGMAIDRNDGTLYVADNSAQRIVVFDKDGNFLRALGGEAILRRPSGVAVSPDGKKVYVVDTGGVDSRKHHLYVFDAHNGDLLQTIGTRGKLEGEFNLPLQTATNKEGTIFVVDGGNFRVQAFNPDGTFKFSFGAIGRRSGQFSRPKGIAIDDEGKIYVVDAAFGNFQIFNPKGRLLMHIGERGHSGVAGEYMLPAGIAVDEDGRIYMVDQFFKKVDIFRPAHLKKDEGFLSSTRLQEAN